MRTFRRNMLLTILCGGMVLSASSSGLFAAQKKTRAEKKSEAAASAGTQEKVDLNSASKKQLDDLPGIGPALAKKIVEGRPYSSVSDLSKAGIPAKTITEITPLVTVGGGASTAEAAPTRTRREKNSAASSSASSGAAAPMAPMNNSAPMNNPSQMNNSMPMNNSAPMNNNSMPMNNSAPKSAPTNSGNTSAAKPTASYAPSNISPDQAKSQGMVWVNLDTGVYHDSTSRFYGKTKKGKYMAEADATKAGYRAAKNEK